SRPSKDRRTPLMEPIETAVEVEGNRQPQGEHRDSEIRFGVDAGLATTLGTWGTYFTPAGIDLRLEFRQLGASRTLFGPMAQAGGELIVFPAAGQTSTRPVAGIDLGLGVSLHGTRLRLDLAWTVAGLLMPPAAGVEHHEEPEAGWLWLATELRPVKWCMSRGSSYLNSSSVSSWRPREQRGRTNPRPARAEAPQGAPRGGQRR
ncbi:hypothetical protein KKA85_04990, partial [bacterium]|nr:hypothetical protein [bacterium]